MPNNLIKALRIINLLVAILCMTSCDSPESDGEKAAKAVVKCEETYNNDLEDNLREYISNFDKYEFISREDARAKVDDIILKVDQEYENNIKKAEQYYLNLKKKYSKNARDNQEFENAYNFYIETYSVSRNGIPFSSDIEKKINSIIPPKPTIEKMKKDLIGRFCQDQETGYFGGSKHEIKENEVKDIEILEETAQKNDYKVRAIIHIQERPGSVMFKVDAEIRYILGDGDDWTIDYLGSHAVEVVKTGQYEKFITASIVADGWDKELHIVNHSDASMMVGGIMCINGEWRKYSAIIDPNCTKTFGGMFFGNVTDFEVHFVERY